MVSIMKVYVRIKSLNRRKSSELMPYELPEGIGTVRGLIAAFVLAEVERFNSKDTEQPLLALMGTEELEERAHAGKVDFGRLWRNKKADGERAVQTALDAFCDGLFRVLMDESELSGLDSPLEIREGAVFTFIRLTFLAGRMW